jgi:hypothetical protein
MTYASAYPNSDISAGAMAAIAIVMVAALACWLIMVYVAAREPRKPPPAGQQAEPATTEPATTEPATTVATPGALTENKHMEAA